MLHRQRQSLTTTFGAKTQDVRKPFTVEMTAQSVQHFNLYNYNELVYYTALVCTVVALMRPSEIMAKNQQVRADNLDRPSVQALYMRNITPYYNQQTQTIFYSCTCRGTKTDKARVDVDVIWAQGVWPEIEMEIMAFGISYVLFWV